MKSFGLLYNLGSLSNETAPSLPPMVDNERQMRKKERNIILVAFEANKKRFNIMSFQGLFVSSKEAQKRVKHLSKRKQTPHCIRVLAPLRFVKRRALLDFQQKIVWSCRSPLKTSNPFN
jgi:hypothetical protein